MKRGLAVAVVVAVLIAGAVGVLGASGRANMSQARWVRPEAGRSSSPSGTFLFLASDGALGSVKADGSDPTIVREPAVHAAVDLAPNHRLLALYDHDSVSVVDLRGNAAERRIFNSFWSCAWAPDSRQIACSTDKTIGQIYVIRVDGSARRQITRNTRATSKYYDPYNQLAWSPDGKRIAFVNWQHYDWHHPPSGGRLLTIASAGGREVRGPRLQRVPAAFIWSPDGRAFAVSSWHDGVVVARDSQTTVLRGSDGFQSAFDLAWSPDGTRIAALGGDITSGDAGVVAAVDGSFATRFTSGSSPVWSPDARRLAFLRHGALAISDRDGHHVRTVKTTANIDELLAWIR